MPKTITTDELKEKLDSEDFFLLIDVLPARSYLLYHLPGALNIPMEQLHEAMAVIPTDTEIVTYCTGPECRLSLVAAQRLELHDYDKVWHYEGGLQEWAEAGHPLYRELPEVREDIGHPSSHEHA